MDNKDRIFNYAESEHYQFRDGDNFFIQANFKPEKKDEALNLLKQEIAALAESEITDEEFLKAVKKVKTGLAAASETVSDIADMIGNAFTVLYDIKLLEEVVSVVDTITKDDLINYAKNNLNINNAVISTLVPDEK